MSWGVWPLALAALKVEIKIDCQIQLSICLPDQTNMNALHCTNDSGRHRKAPQVISMCAVNVSEIGRREAGTTVNSMTMLHDIGDGSWTFKQP